jgi:hypothetical protein
VSAFHWLSPGCMTISAVGIATSICKISVPKASVNASLSSPRHCDSLRSELLQAAPEAKEATLWRAQDHHQHSQNLTETRLAISIEKRATSTTHFWSIVPWLIPPPQQVRRDTPTRLFRRSCLQSGHNHARFQNSIILPSTRCLRARAPS